MGLFLGTSHDLPDDEWEKRFYYATHVTTAKNRIGYGPEKPYVPPLENPQTLFGVIERHDLLYDTGSSWNWWFFLFSLPFMMWVNGVGNGDSDDLYWYNNAMAEGAQSYPHGIHKYYDIFSLKGYLRYLIDYITVYIIEVTGRVTIIPVDIIHAWFNKDNENWKMPLLVYGIHRLGNPFIFPITKILFAYIQIEVERGFYFDYTD